jgi:hypothetical protein
MELAVVIDVTVLFNCKEWTKIDVTEKIQTALYVLCSAD